MKRQGGFTLIEMIVVIVILGILAVTAAPRFLNFTGEARVATLQGVQAAILSASSITNAASHLEGVVDGPLADTTVMVNRYPAATDAGIGFAVDTQGDIEVYSNTGNTALVWGFADGDTDCTVSYTAPAALGDLPTVTIEDTCG